MEDTTQRFTQPNTSKNITNFNQEDI